MQIDILQKIDNITYWTKAGIVRVCILLQNDEALAFAEFLEDTI